MSFKGKVVIVTGASAGIGAAIAEKFGTEEAKVVLVGRTESTLQEVAKKCKDALVIRADVTKKVDAERIIVDTIKTYGHIDVLINNAGTIPPGTLFDGKILDSFDEAFGYIRAIVHLTSLAAPYLIKTKGNIVNISGIGGFALPPAPYILMTFTAKAAMNHFSTCAAGELAPHGVRVNVVSPGPTDTPIFKSSGLDITINDLRKGTALGRVLESEEVADLVLYVAGDKAKGITGSNYVIDNGFLLKK